jgi:hypothetical protein
MNYYKNKKQYTQKKQLKRPQRLQRYTQQIEKHEDKFNTFCSKKSIELTEFEKKELFTQLTTNYQFQQQQVLQYQGLNHPHYLITINNKNKYNFLLFLTKINGKNYSVFIYNKCGRLLFFSVKLSFSEELYSGTLLNGELVKKNKINTWFFYLTDLIYYMGKFQHSNILSNKIQIMGDILKEKYEYDECMNPCHIKIKSYFLINHLQFIKTDCQLLFVSEYNEPSLFLDIVIPKREQEKIEDGKEKKFIIKKTDNIDVYELYDIKTNKFNSIACVNKLKTSMKLREEFKTKDSFYIQAKYSEYFSNWIPIV